jgi:hypothetical protein
MEDVALRQRSSGASAQTDGTIRDVGGGAGALPSASPAEPGALLDALPMLVFRDYLRRLHDGPVQDASTVRVALAVWQQAIDRGDLATARHVTGLLHGAVDGLLTSLVELQELGRVWAGHLSLGHDEQAAAAQAAAAWTASRGPHPLVRPD